MLIQQPTPIGVTAAAVATTTVIPAPAASQSDITPKRIRIISGVLTGGGAAAGTVGTLTLQSHVTVANKSGVLTLLVGQPLVLPFNEAGWFWCNLGEALDFVTTGTGFTVAGELNYVTE
jgi:hypothetical protein